jgi:hypothetical protein
VATQAEKEYRQNYMIPSNTMGFLVQALNFASQALGRNKY